MADLELDRVQGVRRTFPLLPLLVSLCPGMSCEELSFTQLKRKYFVKPDNLLMEHSPTVYCHMYKDIKKVHTKTMGPKVHFSVPKKIIELLMRFH